ncbi:histidine phosphatase family protein [Nitrospirillum iridis]|uniref:Alpha-ribazole phosphatase n=1 Tax=Nitrospirillum iridis TaxID=765888 RepID=A0A7X0AV02_9PROT|nr:histidine phosphatase family protein [Nitrospirillum iridis]MBB6249640.1 alpha-ribazole phosphatase [Nitrospirillum iridis]
MIAGAVRWWWVRHAPLAEPHRIAGQSDAALAPWPEADAHLTAARLPPGALWLASPLTRTRQTVERLAALVTGRPPLPETDPRLMEQHFGTWQGHSYAALEDAGDPHLAAFWADPAGTAPPGGESFADLCHRVAAAVEDWSGRQTGGQRTGDRDIVCVCHAGPVRAAVALALDLSPAKALALDVSPLSITRLDRIATDAGPVWAVRGVNRAP